MPSLLEIWEKGELKKYPPLPDWCLEALGGPNWSDWLENGNQGVEDMADSIWFDENRKVWSRIMVD